MNYRTYQDMSLLIRQNAWKVPANVDLIVSIPRSGNFPAAILASLLNKPTASFDAFLANCVDTSGFYRSSEQENILFNLKKILILDDSYCSGKNLNAIKSILRERNLTDKFHFLFGAIYYTPGNKDKLDISFEEVPLPRCFQWNILNHPLLENSCVDIDGVVCRDPSDSENDDGSNYLSFLQQVEPLIQTKFKIGCFVSSRLEKYRKQTEVWLRNNGFQYGSLTMLNLPSKQERIRLQPHAIFKAQVYASRPETLFIESDLGQAKFIAEETGKTVFCTEIMNFIPTKTASLQLADNISTANKFHRKFHCLKDFIHKQKMSTLRLKISHYSLFPTKTSNKVQIKYIVRKGLKYLLPYAIERAIQKYILKNSDQNAKSHFHIEEPYSYCPFCQHTSVFLPCGVDNPRPHGSCPFCSSLERDRVAYYIYQVTFLSQIRPLKVLHLAPEKCTYNLLLKQHNLEYTCMDLCPENFPWAENIEKQDALHTTYPAHCYDVIIANHLIEHIPEKEFFSEMKRIMKPDAVLIISTPVYWDQAKTLDDPKFAQSTEDRKHYFGQADHIRKYGADIVSRFQPYFASVQILTEKNMRPFGDVINSNFFILRNR